MKILEVNGKEYLVHYTINSLVRMEEETNKSFTDLLGGEDDDMAIGELRDIIYYGLVSKQYKFTKAEAGILIDEMIEEGSSILDITQKFLKELTKALGLKIAEIGEDGEVDPN